MGMCVSFMSTIPYTGMERIITVYLPPGYSDSEKRYPVLYMHDNQNLFDKARSAFGEVWHIDNAIDSLVYEGRTQGVIVVGIDNPASDNEDGVVGRFDEYSPWVNTEIKKRLLANRITRDVGGYGKQYGKFIIEGLKPMIDEQFRTLPDREHTGIAGSSMGGLISLYIGLKYKDVFSKVGAFSPAVWFAEKELLEMIKDFNSKMPIKWYLDIGTKESSNDEIKEFNDIYLKGTIKVYESLLNVGVKKENLKLVIDEGAIHNEKAWARRFPEAFCWLFD